MDRVIKENDVFSFRYFQEVIDNNKSRDLNHCFDGQLVAKIGKNGNIYLEDTYCSSDNKQFHVEQALELGVLKFKFNLDEVEKIEEYMQKYYDDEDLFTFHRQKSSYKLFLKRKGAKRSQKRMEQELKDQISKAQSELRYYEQQIIRHKEDLIKVQNGEKEIYF